MSHKVTRVNREECVWAGISYTKYKPPSKFYQKNFYDSAGKIATAIYPAQTTPVRRLLFLFPQA